MSFCKGCFRGVTHSGTPKGTIEKINGVDVYIAIPEVDYPIDKALLILPDTFGLLLVNNKLIADDFAANGFQTYLVDYLNGDPMHPDTANDPDFLKQAYKWLENHGADKTRPPVEAVIQALKERGVTRFATNGYCFGGPYVFALGSDNVVQVSTTSHPSLLVIPDDFEKYAAHSRAPLLINSAGNDEVFPTADQAKADLILGKGKFAPGFEQTRWPGTDHGFAIRGDLSDPNVKAGKEGAFKATVEFLHNYL